MVALKDTKCSIKKNNTNKKNKLFSKLISETFKEFIETKVQYSKITIKIDSVQHHLHNETTINKYTYKQSLSLCIEYCTGENTKSTNCKEFVQTGRPSKNEMEDEINEFATEILSILKEELTDNNFPGINEFKNVETKKHKNNRESSDSETKKAYTVFSFHKRGTK